MPPSPARTRLSPRPAGLALMVPFVLLSLSHEALASPPLVVASDGILCDLTRTLAADQARVVCLLPPGTDPHQYQLRPRDRQALSEAQLVLINGYGLSPALLQVASRTPKVAVAELAVPASPGRDPHVWHDPSNATAMLRVVDGRLAAVLPAAAQSGLKRRSAAARSVLEDTGRWAAAQMATVPEASRVLVTEHRAFASFARRYDLRELPLLPSFTSGGQLRPSSLAAITKAIKASGTRQLFSESQPISKTLRRISRSSGIPVNPTPLVADGLAPGRSTVQTATGNVCTFVIGQGGRCDEAGAERLSQRWSAIP
ncbi:MAG: metal ABC transporter substrate-binding protein [Synechococcaceae cyanobacterium]|nr:metal ABC transporter substrate-binding protein [Synechococcaceae cyanobacterium]